MTTQRPSEHHRVDPWTLADGAELGALGRALHLPRLPRRRAELAGHGRRRRSAAPRSFEDFAPRRGGGRGALRGHPPRARCAADHHRALVRRAGHADPPRSRPRRRGRGPRLGPGQRHLEPAVVLAQIGLPGAQEPGQQPPRRGPHAGGVSLRVHQHPLRRSVGGGVPALRGAGPQARALPGPLASFNPHAATKIDFHNDDRAPLLLVTGSLDHVSPPAIGKANAALQHESKALRRTRSSPADRTSSSVRRAGKRSPIRARLGPSPGVAGLTISPRRPDAARLVRAAPAGAPRFRDGPAASTAPPPRGVVRSRARPWSSACFIRRGFGEGVMRANRIHRFGPPEVIVFEEVEMPVPGQGQVLDAGEGRGRRPVGRVDPHGQERLAPAAPPRSAPISPASSRRSAPA